MFAVATVVCLSLADGRAQPPPDRVIHIVAERFTFTPSTVTVDEGAAVELRITSDDTDHGFRLVGPNDQEIDVLIPKRGRGDVRVRLDTSAPGEYRFECSHVCGAGHSFMRGVVRVRPNAGASGARTEPR
jgi:heme/copper-type cytochrome/quinol oxidase subunit 2